MIYPLYVSAEEWARRYEIDVSPRVCDNCGVMLIPEIPYAYKEWRGLKSKPHKCGQKYDLMVMVSINPETRKFWSDLHNRLNDDI